MNVRHGMYRSPEYASWRKAKERCRNRDHHAWARYGGRGIVFADRWDDFMVFLADMGPRPSPRHSLDRIDNDKGYEPGNCRWATKTEQSNNTCANRFLTIDGRTLTVMEWSRESGVPYAAIRMRLGRQWDIRRAVFEPVPVHSVAVGGVTKTITEWAKMIGLAKSTVYRRIRRGMDPVQAVQHPGRRRAA